VNELVETEPRGAIEALFARAKRDDHRLTVAVHTSLFGEVYRNLSGFTDGYYFYLKKPAFENLPGVAYLEFPRYQKILGSTSDFVIFDSSTYFDANAFAASADAVKGGGAFVILLGQSTPYYEPLGRGRFSGRLLSVFLNAAAANGLFLSLLPSGWSAALPPDATGRSRAGGKFMSADQEACYDKILEWYGSGSDRILFITSRRGRGKSSVVGMSLASLVDKEDEIFVTSASIENLSSLLRHLSLSLRERGYEFPERVWNKTVRIGTCTFSVGSPDRVRSSGLLVIDEASMLPVSRLLELVTDSPRTILSTTTYGYEGSGRSFGVRLIQRLGKLGVKEIKLFAPVRFSDGDPLEKSLNETFAFDPLVRSYPPSAPVRTEWLDLEQLGERGFDFARRAYTILTEAHYRNEPSDLLRMLEDDRSFTAVASVGTEPCAVASLVEDGPLAPAVADSVLRGASHPGNLISERLLARTFDRRIALYDGIRVVRIAVIPHLQRKRYGRMLLDYIEGQATRYDWVGAAFSAETGVLRFWMDAGYKFVHISWNREPYAFNPSVVCIKPLTQRAAQFIEENMARFREGVILHLVRNKMLSPAAYAVVMRSLSSKTPVSNADRSRLESFTEWNLPLELVVPELMRNAFTLAHLMSLESLESLVRVLCDLPFSQKTLKRGLRSALSAHDHTCVH